MRKLLGFIDEFIKRTMSVYMVAIPLYVGVLVIQLLGYLENKSMITSKETLFLVFLFVMPLVWPFVNRIMVATEKVIDSVQQLKKKRIEQD